MNRDRKFRGARDRDSNPSTQTCRISDRLAVHPQYAEPAKQRPRIREAVQRGRGAGLLSEGDGRAVWNRIWRALAMRKHLSTLTTRWIFVESNV
jgi:hypothetical protein